MSIVEYMSRSAEKSRFQGLSYQLQCLGDANGVILFFCIRTNKKLYIVEKQQLDHYQ